MAGTLFADSTSSLSFKREFAFTSVIWPGSPPPNGCTNAPCYYSVVSNCTPETSPPDWPVFEVAGGDYKVTKIVAWTAVNFCERILLNGTAIGPWICNPGDSAHPRGPGVGYQHKLDTAAIRLHAQFVREAEMKFIKLLLLFFAGFIAVIALTLAWIWGLSVRSGVPLDVTYVITRPLYLLEVVVILALVVWICWRWLFA